MHTCSQGALPGDIKITMKQRNDEPHKTFSTVV